MLKILGGEFRRRQLGEPPDRVRSRPMPARVKESIFNLLRGWFEDARILDLFAGIGTLGLEAVSRGAADVVMVERDKEIHSILEWNIRELGCEDRCRAVKADALGPSALTARQRSSHPSSRMFHSRIEWISLSRSTMTTSAAPRLTASSPTVPMPAKRSRTRASSNHPRRRLKIDSLTRAGMGRERTRSGGSPSCLRRNSPPNIFSMMRSYAVPP